MILLQAIDQRWKEHLQRVDQLREWINLRAYAQKEPLNEYKKEAFSLFEETNFLIKSETLEKLFKIQLVARAHDDTMPEIDGVSAEEAQESLEALKPKRQRMSFSSGPEPNEGNGGDEYSGLSRSERRKLEREKKKRK